MSMERYPRNPIEKRKQEVRKNSRNAVISVAGGLGGGALMWLLADPTWMVIGLIVAVVGGLYFYNKVRKTINEKDQY
ncbi:hypothetical protein [Corynebacterium pacaense]|uniref:hypothetical protein n=1 Tax=Corynebacterium pacaense TaxID=1816684 RepID=UPI0009BB82BF|nr:hypothetical protein [Corynebacterium pacaense]